MTLNIGIYNLHMQAMGGGEKLTLVLAAQLSRKYNVTLFCSELPDVESLEVFFDVDLSRVKFVALKPMGLFSRVFMKIRGKRAPRFPFDHFFQIRKLNLDIFINNSFGSGLRCPAERGIYMCMFPHEIRSARDENLADRLSGNFFDWIEKRLTNSFVDNPLNSYQRVVAISHYSAQSVRTLWSREPEIIYPPCDDMGPSSHKAKIILNVGRFVASKHQDGRHQKGQQVMLDAFKRLSDLHKDGWQLHFVGSVGSDEDSTNLAKRIVQHSNEAPVFFHFNATLLELQDLYRRAAVYWHATGFGFDGLRHPGQQEHFGISTVEAMSAGAVPLVYGSGGQKEIVTDRFDGFWWYELDELIAHTVTLASNSSLRIEMSEKAILSSKKFARQAFANKIDQLVSSICS